ncbi:uncharacterized protein L199_007154 [Kwoniella botswanensis]
MHDASIIFFAGLCSFLVILPLPLQWRARNSGTILLITWLFIGNILSFVNGLTWWDSIENVAPVWCDISTKLSVGLTVGVAASSLCITRRLVMIASSTTVTFTQRQKRIALCIDIFLGILLPIIVMALHYTVQPHRFDIYEGYGCQVSTWPSIPSIFAVSWWPVLLSLTAAVYGVVAIKFFLSRRLQFQTLLRSSKSGLNNRHYVRLMALASVDILLGLPLTVFSLSQTVIKRQPYESWAIVHYNWSRVDQYHAYQVLNTAGNTGAIVLPRWHAPLLSIIFFLFFGVSIDSINEYCRWIDWFKSKLPPWLVQPNKPLPIFVPKLGSTVARPIAGDWKEPSTLEESIIGETQSDKHMRGSQTSGLEGVTVAVRVEREVV